MKKIGILSDTHSCWDDRYAAHFQDCDEIWHAGDIGDIDIIRRLEDVVPTVSAAMWNVSRSRDLTYGSPTSPVIRDAMPRE